MNHPAELPIHQYLDRASNGQTTMSDETIEQVAQDIKDALKRQFGGGNKRDEFRLRMSNIGRPTCQLWWEKNHPEKALPKPTTFVMNMLIGDIVEAAFKGILKEYNGRYSSAMSSGKVLDFRDSIMADLQRTDKYQKAVRSAAALANFDAYEVGKDSKGVSTKGLLSENKTFPYSLLLFALYETFQTTEWHTERCSLITVSTLNKKFM